MSLQGNAVPTKLRKVLNGKIKDATPFNLDESLSLEGAAAEAKAVGDALKSKASTNDVRTIVNDYLSSNPPGAGNDGEDGATFIPAVTDGYLSWTNDKGLENPPHVYIKGAKGDKGDKGDTGERGLPGEKGDKGDTGAQGEKGLPGEKGDTGNGIASVVRTAGNGAAGTTDTYTITFTDGTTSKFTVYNGRDGTGGSGGTGADGEDGATFIPALDSSGNLSWSNDKGLPNPATVNIKGPKGDTGDKGDTGAPGADGAKGDKGDKGDTGATGANGTNGVSATHSWSGTRLSVTSASGTSSADLKGEKGDKGDTGSKGDKGDTGESGYSPVRGTDYWTASDIAEIKSYVDNAILGGAW